MTLSLNVAGKVIGVFGLGKAGLATLDSLLASGADVHAFDDNQRSVDAARKLYPSAHFHTPELWPWQQIRTMVLGPGIPFTHPSPHLAVTLATQAGAEVIGDVELLYRAAPHARYIGITGTNGKSTTTSLIAHLLKESGVSVEVGGNLGIPALSLKPLASDGVYVLELSSYQLDLVRSTRMNVAVFLNLTPDHLDRHGDMQGYHAAKRHIFARQQAGDVAVVAVDDEYTQATAAMLDAKPATVVRVSAASKADVYAEAGILHAPEGDIDLRRIRSLQGQHNWQNAVCAYSAARAAGVTHADIARAMASFAGLAHRMEWIADIGHVTFINDSKATNADATQHALRAFQDVFWIVGGKAKDGGIDSLTPYFDRIRHAYLIGAAADAFATVLNGTVPYTVCGTMDVAVSRAAQDASKVKDCAVVLLSPACASFDQFKSFEERGDIFRALVHSWAASHAA